MSNRTAARLAWSLGLFALAFTVGGLTFSVKNGADIWSFDGLFALVSVAAFGGLGVLLVSRRPRNPIGWIFVATSVAFGLAGLADQYSRYGLVTNPGGADATTWLEAFLNPTCARWAYDTAHKALHELDTGPLNLHLRFDG